MSGKGKATPSSLATRVGRLEDHVVELDKLLGKIFEGHRELLKEHIRILRESIEAQEEKIGHLQRAVDGLQQRTGINYAGIALDFPAASNLNERLHWVEAQLEAHLGDDVVQVTLLSEMRRGRDVVRAILRDWVRDPWILYPLVAALGVTVGILVWIYS